VIGLRILRQLRDSTILNAVPLVLYLFLGGSSFLALVDAATGLQGIDLLWNPSDVENPAAKLSAELLKQKIQAVGYLLTLLLLIGRIERLIRFFLLERAVLCLCLVLGATVLVSDSPERVIANLVHLTFGLLAIWVWFDHPARRQHLVRSACLVVLVPCMALQLGSLAVWLLHKDSNVFLLIQGQRYSGLSGNPNSFGGICIISAWACFSLIREAPAFSRSMILLGAATAIVMFNSFATGSATTLLIIVAMALSLLTRAAYVRLGSRGRAATIMGVATVLIVGTSVVLVQQSADDYALAATEAVGKDLTLTGRTDLWVTAFEAFKARPILGWGYDNHETVYATGIYEVPYTQYHNGYMDNLVNGGVILMLAIGWCFVRFAGRYRQCIEQGYAVFPMLVIFGAISVHNLTEYSLVRATSPLAELWLLSYLGIAFLTVRVPGRAEAMAGAGRRRVRSRRPQASW